MANKIEQTWIDWTDSKDKNTLGKLFNKYNGMIYSAVNKYDNLNRNIPREALEAEAKHQAFIAFSTYDPSRKTMLSTHVGNRLKKLYSYTSKYTNVAKIPEGEISSIRVFNQAKDFLRQRFKREPSAVELADQLSWPIKRVSKMEASIRGDFMAVGDLQNIKAYESNPAFDRIRFAYYDLTPEEQIIYDYTSGEHGKPRLKPGEIARVMGISNSKVSSIKNNIAKKLEQYLG